MIQMADVGVGICGQEGRQAVMASDFAMGQFKFLKRLLLVHGHWNYQRIGYLVLYNFYRNAVFVLMLFWYALFSFASASLMDFLQKENNSYALYILYIWLHFSFSNGKHSTSFFLFGSFL